MEPSIPTRSSLVSVKHTPKDLLPTIPIGDFTNLHRAVGTFWDAEFVLELVAVQSRHVQERIVVFEGTIFANCIICRRVLLAGCVSSCIGFELRTGEMALGAHCEVCETEEATCDGQETQERGAHGR